MKLNIQYNLPYILIFLFLAIPFFKGTAWQYIVIIFFAAVLILIHFRGKIPSPLKIERIPAIFFVIWLYGVIMGLFYGNDSEGIIQNFAGMAIFPAYYILKNVRNIRIYALYKAIYYASVIVSAEVLICFLLNVRGITPPWPINNIYYNRWTSSIFTISCCISFFLEAMSLYGIINERGIRAKIKHFLFFSLATSALVFTTDSGGFLLGYIIIFGVVVFACVLNRQRGPKDWVLAIFLFLLILTGVLIYGINRGFISDIFSVNTVGNDKRYYQFQLVFERFRIFGNGLGAKFDYYVGRNRYGTYGIEVSYLNLIDKFGILGIFLIFEYVYLFVKPIWMFLRRYGDNRLNMAAIGMQGYLFVALGNPVLYAPYNVCLQIFTIFFLANNLRKARS